MVDRMRVSDWLAPAPSAKLDFEFRRAVATSYLYLCFFALCRLCRECTMARPRYSSGSGPGWRRKPASCNWFSGCNSFPVTEG